MTRLAFATVLAAATFSLAALAQPGYGPGPGARGGPRFNDQTTPGWSLMTAAERKEHQEKMRGLKDYDECRAYMEKHHALMAERAKEKGRTLPGAGPGPGCDWLKK